MDEYTGGTVATMVVVPLLLLGCLVVAGWAHRARKADYCEEDLTRWWWIRATAIAAAAAITVLTWWGMYPWRAEYHEYRQVSGVITAVEPRLVSNVSGGMEDKFVVRFSGDDREYGVLDTRVAAARVGDRLTVGCVRRWQWSGTHGFDCVFVDLTEGWRR